MLKVFAMMRSPALSKSRLQVFVRCWLERGHNSYGSSKQDARRMAQLKMAATIKSCDREPQVVAEAIAGELPESLLRHEEICRVCSEAVTAVKKLRLLSGEPFAAPLPSAASLWWKATLQKQQAAGLSARVPL